MCVSRGAWVSDHTVTCNTAGELERAPRQKSYYLAAVLMDLSAAFDCLPHEILVDKLLSYGITPHSVSLLKSYLTGRKQHIKLENILSSWTGIHERVMQCSILDPLFFMYLQTIFLLHKIWITL